MAEVRIYSMYLLIKHHLSKILGQRSGARQTFIMSLILGIFLVPRSYGQIIHQNFMLTGKEIINFINTEFLLVLSIHPRDLYI